MRKRNSDAGGLAIGSKKGIAHGSAAEQEAAAPAAFDLVGEALVAAGFFPNHAVLSINNSVGVPGAFDLSVPWDLPSRLFEFPIAVSSFDGVNQRRMSLQHPLLADHPFVRHFEARMEIPLSYDGAEQGVGTWWHAVDLVCAGRWLDLLESRQFTTEDDIAGAVTFGLGCAAAHGKKPMLSVKNARAIMAAIGADEPVDRHAGLSLYMRPLLGKGKTVGGHVPINHLTACGGHHALPLAWSRIHGVEEGWFTYCRDGHLSWSPRGIEFYAARGGEVVFEKTGQGAFCF